MRTYSKTRAISPVWIAAMLGSFAGPHRLDAQSRPPDQPAGARFEVASIKLSTADPGGQIGIKTAGDRVSIGRWSMKQLLLKAYRLETYQVAGPEWIESTRFDILAKLPAGVTQAEVPDLLKSLLLERFGLKVHNETRQLSGYALVVGKGGPKMKPAVREPGDSEDTSNTLDDLMGDGSSFGAKMSPTSSSTNMRIEFTKVPVRALAQIAGSYLREPVFDMTELKGRYRVALEFSPATTYAVARNRNVSDTGPAGASDPGEITLFSAMNELGLKLERRKGPVSILVVDHAEKSPTAN